VINDSTQMGDGAYESIPNAGGRQQPEKHRCTDQMNAASAEYQVY